MKGGCGVGVIFKIHLTKDTWSGASLKGFVLINHLVLQVKSWTIPRGDLLMLLANLNIQVIVNISAWSVFQVAFIQFRQRQPFIHLAGKCWETVRGKILGYISRTDGLPIPDTVNRSYVVRERVHTTQGTQSLSLPQAHGYRLRPTYFISLRALSKVTYAGVRISLRSKSKKSSILWWCDNTEGTTVICSLLGRNLKKMPTLKNE